MTSSDEPKRVPTEDFVEFGPYRVDCKRRKLFQREKPKKLGNLEMRLLLALLANRGTILSKAWLSDFVWNGVSTEDGAFYRAVCNLRKALGDRVSAPKYIFTESRAGYRFIESTSDKVEPADKETIPSANQGSWPRAAESTRDDLPEMAYKTNGESAERSAKTFDLHKRYINDFDWLNDDSTMFASAGEDETVKIVSTRNATTIRSLPAQAAAKCLTFAFDHSLLIYGTSMGDVCSWRVDTPPNERVLLYRHPLIRALGYSVGNSLLASGGYDKYLRIYKLDPASLTIREIVQSERTDVVRALAWASDKSSVAFASGAEVNIISVANDLKGTSDEVRLLGHTGVVLSICWNNSGNLVASGDEHGSVIVWNPMSRRHIARLDRSKTLTAARSLCFHPEQQDVLAVGGKSGALEIIKVSESGSPSIVSLGHFGDFINAVRWHHSGSRIAFACGGAIKLLATDLPGET